MYVSNFSQEIYAQHLKKIGDVEFSAREVEIIAAILLEEETKKIPKIVPISEEQKNNKTIFTHKISNNTVEAHIEKIYENKLSRFSEKNDNHLKNIRTKREKIKYIIERSDKYVDFLKYCDSIKTENIFLNCLEKIFQKQLQVVGKESIGSVVINYFGSAVNLDLLPYKYLTRYFNQRKDKNEKKIITTVLEDGKFWNKKTIKSNYLFCVLSEDIILSLNDKESEISKLFSYLSQDPSAKLDKIIFLLHDWKNKNSIPELVRKTGYVLFKKQENYYTFVFKVLKKIFPQILLDDDIAEFTKEYVKLNSKRTLRVKSKWFWSAISFLVIPVLFFGTWQYLYRAKKEVVINWNLPRQECVFVGREELLLELSKNLHSLPQQERIFFSSNSTKKDRGIATHTTTINTFAGLGGIGKTQLALQYIHTSSYPYTLRAWFPAENIDQLRQKYIEFAQVLGYKQEKPSINEVIVYVKKWLSEHPGWLLVYDNVSTYEEIKPFLPEGGYIVLTTRQQHDWPSNYTVTNINLMTEREAIFLIESKIDRSITREEEVQTKELVKNLGYLPLALAQAGAYIKQNQIEISEYLGLYKTNEQELLSDKTEDGSKSIAITWNVSLNAMSKEAKTNDERIPVHEILTACAYLAPEKISREMLFFWFKRAYPNYSSQRIAFLKQIKRYVQYSMISQNNDSISIHRLVQSVLRNQHKLQNKSSKTECSPLTASWYKTLLEAVHLYFNEKSTPLEEESLKKNLLPHLQVLVEHCDKLPWTDKYLLLMKSCILKDIADVFHFLIGDSYSAKPYYDEALKITENYYGTDHVEVAKILTDFGDTYGTLGDPVQQKKFLERALTIKERHNGKNHVDLLSTLESLGAAYWALGEGKKGKEILERALRIGEYYYKGNSLEIFKTLYYLACVCGDLGYPNLQKEHLERALVIGKQHYGNNHIQVSFILENLGIAYRILGNINQGKNSLEQALLIQESYYGKDHVEVGETLSNLSRVYLDLGNAQKAKELLERAIIILESYYEKNHVYVARASSYLGDVLIQLGDFTKAQEILEKVLCIKEKFYGKHHISVAVTLTSLGDVYTALKKSNNAKEYLERALSIKKDYYGEEHPEVGITLLSLAKTYVSLQEFREAIACIKKGHSIFLNAYGCVHLLTQQSSNLLKHFEKLLD